MRKIDLLNFKKDCIAEIKVLLDEITGIQIERLEHPFDNDIDDSIVEKDFERLERLLDIVLEINEQLEERGEQNGN